MSSKFGDIRPWTTELALERLEKIHRLIIEIMTSSQHLRNFSSDRFHT